MSLVIVYGHLKGGAGKTTSAMCSAMVYAKRGHRVLVIDGDSVSQTAYDWKTLVDAAHAAGDGPALPFDVERYPFADIGEKLDAAREEYDVIIVDAPGGSDSYLEDAIAAADLLVIVLAPSTAEARRLSGTIRAATRGAERSTRPDGVAAVITLTRADRRTSLPAAWRQQLIDDGHGDILTHTEIGDRVMYIEAVGQVPPTGEYEDLLREIGVLDTTPEVTA